MIVPIFQSDGYVPAGGSPGVAPTVTHFENTEWSNVDGSGGRMPAGGPTAWSCNVNDVLVGVWTWKNSNNTDNLTGFQVDPFGGTYAASGGWSVAFNNVYHDGSLSYMVAVATAVVTTGGTVQIETSGYTFSAGTTRKAHALLCISGCDTSGSRINATNSANYSASPAVTGNAATGGAGIMIAVTRANDSSSVTEVTPWDSGIIANAGFGACDYQSVTTNTTDQGEWTLGSAVNGFGVIVTIKSSTP